MSTMILKIFCIIYWSVGFSEGNEYCLFQNQNHLDGLLVKTNVIQILIILFPETNILVCEHWNVFQKCIFKKGRGGQTLSLINEGREPNSSAGRAVARETHHT